MTRIREEEDLTRDLPCHITSPEIYHVILPHPRSITSYYLTRDLSRNIISPEIYHVILPHPWSTTSYYLTWDLSCHITLPEIYHVILPHLRSTTSYYLTCLVPANQYLINIRKRHIDENYHLSEMTIKCVPAFTTTLIHLTGRLCIYSQLKLLTTYITEIATLAHIRIYTTGDQLGVSKDSVSPPSSEYTPLLCSR